MQCDDVGVLDLLEDANFALDVVLGDPAAAGLAAPLLDEFGGILRARAPPAAFPHHRKLTAAGKERRLVKCHTHKHKTHTTHTPDTQTTHTQLKLQKKSQMV